MAAGGRLGKFYRPFTFAVHSRNRRNASGAFMEPPMVGLALAIFIALFAWGAKYFGWQDPVGKVQLALFTSFILGAICGYKSKD